MFFSGKVFLFGFLPVKKGVKTTRYINDAYFLLFCNLQSDLSRKKFLVILLARDCR